MWCVILQSLTTRCWRTPSSSRTKVILVCTWATMHDKYERCGSRRVESSQERITMHRCHVTPVLRNATHVDTNIHKLHVSFLTTPDDIDHYTRRSIPCFVSVG